VLEQELLLLYEGFQWSMRRLPVDSLNQPDGGFGFSRAALGEQMRAHLLPEQLCVADQEDALLISDETERPGTVG
jgi:hypothetical protein